MLSSQNYDYRKWDCMAGKENREYDNSISTISFLPHSQKLTLNMNFSLKIKWSLLQWWKPGKDDVHTTKLIGLYSLSYTLWWKIRRFSEIGSEHKILLWCFKIPKIIHLKKLQETKSFVYSPSCYIIVMKLFASSNKAWD